MKLRKTKLLVASILLLAASCKKDFNNDVQAPSAPKGVDPAKVYKLPTTPEEKLRVKNIEKLTDIFKELYKNSANSRLVRASILARPYYETAVLIKDLIYPSISRLNRLDKFKTLSQEMNVSLSDFADNFWAEVRKKNDPEFSICLDEQYVQENTGNARNNESNHLFSVYDPNADPNNPLGVGSGGYGTITLVSAGADADEAMGNRPYYINDTFQYNIPVLVNDDYVYNNPTHIIGVAGITQESTTPPVDAPPPPQPPPSINRVYVGEVVCRKQFDRLISFTGNGGGSEIMFCRINGYLQPVNGQITSFQDIISVHFTRREIRDNRMKRIYGVWNDDWVPANTEQVFVIYEEDNTSSITFNGSLTTSLTISAGNTIGGSIGYSFTRQSQDAIIRQLKISRNSYFAGALQNQGWGFSSDRTFLPASYSHGWPYYDLGADVGWTWPYNKY